jgi:hypothetical protein
LRSAGDPPVLWHAWGSGHVRRRGPPLSQGQALANRADCERGAAQHAEGGVAKRVDALGVKVVVQHAAQNLPNMIERDRCSLMTIVTPDSALPAGRLAGWGGAGNRCGQSGSDLGRGSLQRFSQRIERGSPCVDFVAAH